MDQNCSTKGLRFSPRSLAFLRGCSVKHQHQNQLWCLIKMQFPVPAQTYYIRIYAVKPGNFHCFETIFSSDIYVHKHF